MASRATGEPVLNYLEWSDRGRPAIWRYLLAIVLGFVAWVWGGIVPIVLVFRPLGIDVNTDPVAPFYTFTVGLVVLPLLVLLLLRRPAYSLALPSWPPRMTDYGLGVLIQWVSMAIMYAVAAQVGYRGFPNVTLALVGTVVAALIGLFIQTTFEELFFRGLVAQGTRRIVKWLPVVIGVQALWFASMHAGNVGAWAGTPLASLPYLVPALAWGWIAWRTGSLVIPAALHFGNNAFLQLFVTTRGDVLHGIAPFEAAAPPIEQASLFVTCQTLIALLFVELVVRRRTRKNVDSEAVSGQPAQ